MYENAKMPNASGSAQVERVAGGKRLMDRAQGLVVFAEHVAARANEKLAPVMGDDYPMTDHKANDLGSAKDSPLFTAMQCSLEEVEKSLMKIEHALSRVDL